MQRSSAASRRRGVLLSQAAHRFGRHSYLREKPIELVAMIADRDTDLEFAANLNTQGLWVRIHGTSDETSPAVV